MKLKNKGKVHPSPSSYSAEDSLSILKILPATILALASVLSLDDREVLAYMITRSLKTTTTTSTKKPSSAARGGAPPHRLPSFDCDCFDCYTSYWFRWDSSPNRELIHQVIEAFDEHLTNGEVVEKPSKKNSRYKKRDSNGKPAATPVSAEAPVTVNDVTATEKDDVSEMNEKFQVAENEEAEIQAAVTATSSSHKGLARKVLPDVLGLFNSRLWSLWNPNM